jgi:hypothetical protein
VLRSLRSRRSLTAENLFLRRQLALWKERAIRPRRIDPATRVSLAVLAKLCNWREALIVLSPETLIRWHRAGWRLLWRYKSQTGRPPCVPDPLREIAVIRNTESRRLLAASLLVLARSVLAGLHHEYLLAPAIA